MLAQASRGRLSSLKLIILNDIKMTLRQAFSWLTPLLFFIIVVCLFPLALGPDQQLLNAMAPGIIWVAAILAIVITTEQLFRNDEQIGFLDLLLLSTHPLTALILCKILSHWLTHCLPLILVCPLLGFLLNFNMKQEFALILTLLLGTPTLILLGAIGSALTVGIRSPGLLLPIIIVPLYIPTLIFGTTTVMAANTQQALAGYFAVMGAITTVSFACLPLLIGLALRIGVSQ